MLENNWQKCTADEYLQWGMRAIEHLKKCELTLKNVRPATNRSLVVAEVHIGLPGQRSWNASYLGPDPKSVFQARTLSEHTHVKVLEEKFAEALSRSMNEYPSYDKNGRTSRYSFNHQVGSLINNRAHTLFSGPGNKELFAQLNIMYEECNQLFGKISLDQAREIHQKKQVKTTNSRLKARTKRSTEREDEVIDMVREFIERFKLEDNWEFAFRLLVFEELDELTKFKSRVNQRLIPYLTRDRFVAGFKLAQVGRVMKA